MPACKKVLCWERVRRVHRPFGWVDARLIREDWLQDCSLTAWALYLFWVTVADAQGLSYYTDASVARRLRITPADVSAGRAELIRAGLLAYEAPLVQVLALERTAIGRDKTTGAEGAVLVGDVLRAWMRGAGK